MIGTVLLYSITFFAATCCGAVLLIQLGGWLAILSAILILIFYFLTIAFAMISAGAAMTYKDRLKKVEGEKHEGKPD